MTMPAPSHEQRNNIRWRWATPIGLLLAAGLLSACTSAAFSELPAPVGLPKDAPARSAVQPEYPAVHDFPPPRANTVMTDKERKDLEKELTAERERLKRTNPGAKRKKTAKRPRKGTRKAGTQPAGASRNP